MRHGPHKRGREKRKWERGDWGRRRGGGGGIREGTSRAAVRGGLGIGLRIGIRIRGIGSCCLTSRLSNHRK